MLTFFVILSLRKILLPRHTIDTWLMKGLSLCLPSQAWQPAYGREPSGFAGLYV